MAEPRAITFKEIEKAHGEGNAMRVYRKISRIGGFGDVESGFVGGPPALDITGLSDAKREQIERLLVPEEEEAKPKSKKEGTK